MLGNGICDEECNIENWDFDDGDCDEEKDDDSGSGSDDGDIAIFALIIIVSVIAAFVVIITIVLIYYWKKRASTRVGMYHVTNLTMDFEMIFTERYIENVMPLSLFWHRLLS